MESIRSTGQPFELVPCKPTEDPAENEGIDPVPYVCEAFVLPSERVPNIDFP